MNRLHYVFLDFDISGGQSCFNIEYSNAISNEEARITEQRGCLASCFMKLVMEKVNRSLLMTVEYF
jgi:hypothetical protein